jgi:hypothetical protein
MAHFLRRIGPSGRRARGAARAVRPALERFEERVVPAVPLPPTGLVATGASATAIALTWNASPDPTVTGYDVVEKVWVPGTHGGKGSPTGGHYVYNSVATNLTRPADTITGLKVGSSHTYLVTAVNASGQSLDSLPATGETWVAPKFANGPTIFLLSSGAVWSGPVGATAGLTTQVSLLVSGNPLTYAVVSGPPTATVDPRTGVVTYTPAAGEVGTVNVTLKAANPLGAVTQTIQFNVAPRPILPAPTLKLAATSSVYNGQYQQVSATAVGKGGMPVAGTFAIAYNGSTGYLRDAGTYPVLVTFTSLDPAYGNATLLTTFTVTRATPALSYLASPTVAAGTAATVVSGYVSAVPTGEYVIVTLAGVSQAAQVGANGSFSTSFATGVLPVGSYPITYAFPGDANFNAALKATGTLTVIPTAPPRVTLSPHNATVSAGDPVSFTATATGSPTPAVVWQVSTDGGKTFTNITGNTSALTTTLVFQTNAGQNGDKYRAVFTNPLGTVTTTAATLTVTVDTGD